MKHFKVMVARFFILGLTILLSAGCSLAPQKNANEIKYLITARIDDLPDGIEFFLVRRNPTSGRGDTVERTESLNGQFKFAGSISLPGELYWVRLDSSGIGLEKGTKNWIALVLDDSNIELRGSFKKWPDIAIEGSLATSEYLRYMELSKKPLEEAIELEKTAGADTLLRAKAMVGFKQFSLSYFNETLDSYLTPMLIEKSTVLNELEKNILYGKLSTRVKKSFYGEELLESIRTQERVRKMDSLSAINGKITNFSFTVADGRKQNILDVAAKSKYTLIDFWASWCGPCRAAVPGLKKTYDAFHGKGFNIIGISTDKSEVAWKKALTEDGTPWMHGLDNIDHAGKNIFALGAIPAYVLIDHNGEIVATDYLKAGSNFMINKIGVEYLSKDLDKILERLLGK